MRDMQGRAAFARSVFSLSLEQALRASDEILELLPIATCVCDAAGRIVQYNHRAVELWGRAPQPGQTHDQFTAQCRFFGAEGEELPRSKLAEVLQTGKIDPRRGGDGRAHRRQARVAVLLNIDPLINAQGKLVGAINCFQDVTERKRVVEALDRSQQDLRQQEERWNATYEHAAIGIVEIDAEGRFLRVNEAICSIVGGTAARSCSAGGCWHAPIPKDRDVDEELYRRQVAGDIGFYSIEKRFIRKDGRVIWIAVRSSTVRDADGQFSLRRAGGAGRHRTQGGRGAPEAPDRRAQSSRQEHAGDGAIAGDADRARNGFAGSLPQGLRGPADRAQPGARPAHAPALEERGPARHRRRRHGALSGPLRSEQIAIEGEAITVTPRVALTLALALHELTTNAAKYGALSVPAGQHRGPLADRAPSFASLPLLRLEWRERGGPPVKAPARLGFGSRFIEGSVATELQGTARLDFEVAGLRCTMEIPLESAIVDAEAGSP